MVDLTPSTPLETLLPVNIGAITLTEKTVPHITAILPYPGKEKTLATALGSAYDLSLPSIGKLSQKAGLHLVWSGRDQYLLLGGKPASRTLARSAALVDQSDGWTVLRLEGENVCDVMARLCAVDLRRAAFGRTCVAATEMAHVPTLVTRIPKGVELMVGRSFSTTVIARLRAAMDRVAAQQAMMDVQPG